MLVINGRLVDAPGITVRNWLDDPRWRLKAGEDRYPRRGVGGRAPSVQMIVLHTTRGEAAQVLPGYGPSVDPATKTLAHWFSESDNSGAHLWVGPDGGVYQFADLLTEATPHAGNNDVNLLSVGIEIYQEGEAGVLREGQLHSAVLLCDALTRVFNITRRLQWPYLGHPPAALARQAEGGDGGDNYVGLLGHRDASRNRGREDPGDNVIQRFLGAGYLAWNLATQGVGPQMALRLKGRNVVGPARPGDGSNMLLLAAAAAAGAWWISKRRG